MRPAQLLRYLRDGRLIIGADKSKRLWASDSYLLFSAHTEPLPTLLAHYNLAVEPMSCVVDRTIMRQPDLMPPDMTKLVAHRHDIPLTRFCLDDCLVEVQHASVYPDTPRCALFDGTDGRRVAIDVERLNLLEALTEGARWFAASDKDHHGAVARVGEDGTFLGVLMPMRISAAKAPTVTTKPSTRAKATAKKATPAKRAPRKRAAA